MLRIEKVKILLTCQSILPFALEDSLIFALVLSSIKSLCLNSFYKGDYYLTNFPAGTTVEKGEWRAPKDIRESPYYPILNKYLFKISKIFVQHLMELRREYWQQECNDKLLSM